MKIVLKKLALIFPVILIAAFASPAQHDHAAHGPAKNTGKTGVLLLAHGGNANWNNEVKKVAAEVETAFPVEVALGMATKRTIQAAVDKLIARGVKEIVAVPLFVSSNSSVVTSTAFLLGQRLDAPADLAIFARMDHGDSSGTGHDAHTTAAAGDPMKPIVSKVPIKMAGALDANPAVAEILLSRAGSISNTPKEEVVVIVAHGPVSDETNKLWLNDMRKLADIMKAKSGYKRIEYMTVRDDAPEPIRARATKELRSVVIRATTEGSGVLIVPLLLSFGGIEEGVRKRLEGLVYKMSPQALLPDLRISKWVIDSVRKTSR